MPSLELSSTRSQCRSPSIHFGQPTLYPQCEAVRKPSKSWRQLQHRLDHARCKFRLLKFVPTHIEVYMFMKYWVIAQWDEGVRKPLDTMNLKHRDVSYLVTQKNASLTQHGWQHPSWPATSILSQNTVWKVWSLARWQTLYFMHINSSRNNQQILRYTSMSRRRHLGMNIAHDQRERFIKHQDNVDEIRTAEQRLTGWHKAIHTLHPP